MKFQVRTDVIHDTSVDYDFDEIDAISAEEAIREHLIDSGVHPEYGGTITSKYEVRLLGQKEWIPFEAMIYQPEREITIVECPE